MSIVNALEQRRTYYSLNNELPVSEAEVEELVKHITELVPDAFNMKSARVAVAFGDKHQAFWDGAFDAFGGKVAREKMDSFKAAAGTILYFIDQDVVKALQAQFELYADNFPTWAQQANGMLQISIWSALREKNIGASLQHFNPVVDELAHELLDVPQTWTLVAQMPFGGIAAEPDNKGTEDIDQRVKVVR